MLSQVSEPGWGARSFLSAGSAAVTRRPALFVKQTASPSFKGPASSSDTAPRGTKSRSNSRGPNWVNIDPFTEPAARHFFMISWLSPARSRDTAREGPGCGALGPVRRPAP